MFKSIESFKSAFPYFLGCRPNYISQAVSVSSQVKIRLWLYHIWLCTKIMLDPIHNQGLRLALGAFRTSPVASLYVEADEPSLYSRREKLSLQYAIRLAANPSNPAHEVTFPPNYVNLYEQKPKAIKTFCQILYVVSPVNNRISTNYHYTISSTSFLLFYLINFYFSIFIMFSLIPSDAYDPQGLMRR